MSDSLGISLLFHGAVAPRGHHAGENSTPCRDAVAKSGSWVRSDLPLCRWYDLGWFFASRPERRRGNGLAFEGSGSADLAGGEEPMGQWNELREPSGLDEPRRIEPGPGRTVAAPGCRGAGVAAVVGGGDPGVPDPHGQQRPVLDHGGPRCLPRFHRRRYQPNWGVQPGHPRLHHLYHPDGHHRFQQLYHGRDRWKPVLHRLRRNAIEQLNPATHVITTFPIPTAGLGPQFITTGPNGNLYFTASSANVIEQLDPTTRVFRTFFIPTANSGASGITSGPDNSLWFIESTANKIGQLNLATDVVTELPIPTTIGGTSTITTGADGDLYFTEPGSNSIGQFNPITHAFRSLPIPVANSGVANITTGPNGNLYFTEPAANQIGQLNPATLPLHGTRDPDGH